MVWTNENDRFLPKLTLPPGFSGGGRAWGRCGTLVGDLGDSCVQPSQAKHHRIGDPGNVSFLPFLKIKMEKSGLYMAPGVHRLHETCGWAMAALALRPRQKEGQREVGGGMPGPDQAEANLLGQEVTEAQGGITCLRPPCEKGEKRAPAPWFPPSCPGREAAPQRAGSCVEFLCFRSPGLSPLLSWALLACSLGSWAQAPPFRHCTCPVGPCLCEQRFLVAPGNGDPSDLTKPD